MKPFKCSLCEKYFTVKGALKKHVSSVHENDRPHQFSEFESRFKSTTHLKSQIMSVHEENKQYQCMICDKKFKLKCTLEKHITLIHEPKKFTQCSICDVMIVSYRFKRHIIQERKRKEKDIPMLHSFMKTVKIVSQNLKVMSVWLSLHILKVQQGILGKFMKDKNHTCLAYAKNNFLEITY